MAKIMITLPDDFLREIDAIAKAEHRNRSELFREAVRKYMVNNKSIKSIPEVPREFPSEAFKPIQESQPPKESDTSEEYL